MLDTEKILEFDKIKEQLADLACTEGAKGQARDVYKRQALGYASVFGSASNTFLAPVLIGAEVFGFAYFPHFFIDVYKRQVLLISHYDPSGNNSEHDTGCDICAYTAGGNADFL